jgi:ABC-type Fe3+ transport system permease subunit
MSYGAPPPPGGYGQPAYGPMPQQHGSATMALVLGILSFVCCGLLGIPAYIIGKRAEREIQASNGALTGEGMAKAGWILGLIAMILLVVSLLAVVVLFAGGVMTSNTSGGY